MPRVVHFEIHADNPERAVAFYSKVFGWSFKSWGGPMPYWLVSTGNEKDRGIDGGLKPRSHPGEGTVNTIGVASLDESVRQVERKGGKTVVPKMAIPGVGWLAYCADPDGNTFGLLQEDAAAG